MASLTQLLSSRVTHLLTAARQHPLFRFITDPSTVQADAALAVRNVLLRVHLYGPELTRSIFHAIGRMATTDLATAREVAELEYEEAPHPDLAFADYVKLGGDSAAKGAIDRSPAAYVVAATAHMLARHDNPYAFLGFLYLLEATTPVIIEDVSNALQGRHAVVSTEFVSLHRTQDVDHASRLRAVIDRVTGRDAEAARAIAFGFECFSVVYPLPVWSEVMATVGGERATP